MIAALLLHFILTSPKRRADSIFMCAPAFFFNLLSTSHYALLLYFFMNYCLLLSPAFPPTNSLSPTPPDPTAL